MSNIMYFLIFKCSEKDRVPPSGPQKGRVHFPFSKWEQGGPPFDTLLSLPLRNDYDLFETTYSKYLLFF